MNNRLQKYRVDLCKRYSDYDKRILMQYYPAEKFIVVNNNDRDLHPIRIDMPDIPVESKIQGFGLEPKNQLFKIPELSEKLKDLIASSKTIDDIWKKLDSDKRYYIHEIKFIKSQWKYRLEGYWFYNNGVPTYIDGWQYLYISFWHLDTNKPADYVYRDKLFFHFARYCYTTKEATFFHRIKVDGEYKYFSCESESKSYCENNSNVSSDLLEEGEWKFEYNNRTCLGFNYPKHRREGATYKGQLLMFAIISVLLNADGCIQSMDTKSGDEVLLKKQLNPLKKLIFFFKPEIASSWEKPESITFDKKRSLKKTGSTTVNVDVGLQSNIYRYTSGERDADGQKMYMIHNDEVAKDNPSTRYNIVLRLNVQRKCVTQGSQVHGFIVNTSTTTDVKKGAGFNFMRLCKMSMWEERNFITGLTKSGLNTLFIPAYINYEGFSDKHGNPLIEDLTDKQKKEYGLKVGSLEYLKALLTQAEDDPINYYETLREFPTKYRHCFLSSSSESGFNLKILADSINLIDMGQKKLPLRGNFARLPNGNVIFQEITNGKFFVSHIPEQTNQSIIKRGVKQPVNTSLFYASADTFKTENVRDGQVSDGGGAVFMDRDLSIDDESVDVSNYKTNRFVCTYRNRTSTLREYCEDMLMMCEYYSCKIFPENNIDEVEKHFIKEKKKSYLYYNHGNGKKVNKSGFYSNTESKTKMFQLLRDYIELYGLNEKHRDLLEEIRDIEGLSDMTNYDLFTSAGGALLYKLYASRTTSHKTKVKGDSIQDYIKSNGRVI